MMKNPNDYIFTVSLFICLMMGTLSYLSYRRHKNIEFFHLLEFWRAMAVNMLALYVFQDSTPQIRALTMLGWILPLRSFRQVMQDFSGQNNSIAPYLSRPE